MSLAIAVVDRNFIVASSDSAVTNFPIDEKKYEEDGERVWTGKMEETSLKSEKIYKLSDKVLLILTGSHALTKIYEAELSNCIKNESDLSDCMIKAKLIIENMRTGKIENRRQIIFNMLREHGHNDETIDPIHFNLLEEELYKTLDLLGNPTDFSCSLVGFNDDGSSGLYDLNKDFYGESSMDIRKGYPFIIMGHHPGYSEDPNNRSVCQKIMTLPPEKRTIDNFINASQYVHALISRDNINVSSDCNFKVMLRDEKGIEYAEFTVDTKHLYDQLESEPI